MKIVPIAASRTANAIVAVDGAPRSSVNVAPAPTPVLRDDVPVSWASGDVEAFRVFAEANRRTESGGAATFSSLRTTAGPSYRASFGVAQLSIREHLARLARMSDRALVDIGTTRSEVDAMRSRGESAAAFYHLLVDRRDVTHSATSLGIDEATADRLRELVGARDARAIRTLVGVRFETTTGLPSDTIDAMLRTRALRDPETRVAFLDQYAHDHGVPFDPAHRDAARMAATARHVALARADVACVVTTLGGDEPAYTAVGHYLGVGDSAENLLGWHARAAASAVGDERIAVLLRAVDGATSHAREMENFERALAAVARIGDLGGDERIETLARIGRAFHGSPTHARETLFVDGRLDAPRCSSRDELDAVLGQLREGRRWSDERLARRVAEVLIERRTS